MSSHRTVALRFLLNSKFFLLSWLSLLGVKFLYVVFWIFKSHRTKLFCSLLRWLVFQDDSNISGEPSFCIFHENIVLVMASPLYFHHHSSLQHNPFHSRSSDRLAMTSMIYSWIYALRHWERITYAQINLLSFTLSHSTRLLCYKLSTKLFLYWCLSNNRVHTWRIL